MPLDEGAVLGIEQLIAAVEHQPDLRRDHGVPGAAGYRVADQQAARDLIHDRSVQEVPPQLDERVRPDLLLRGKPESERARGEQLLRRLRSARADAIERGGKPGVL